ncbi:MAG: undecaprenyl-phosphate glucose phosphotransferase [Acidobacteria bacterium]|nr:MAG: undecaprenyl-phosphate glucose phosphotransferase [Acidobacteriota bacterium]
MFPFRAYLIQAYLVCFDLAVIGACCVVAWLEFASTETGILPGPLVNGSHVEALVPILVLWLAFSFYFGMYHSRRLDQPFADLVIIAKVSIASLIVLESVGHLAPASELPHTFLAWFMAISFFSLAVARVILRLTTRSLRRRGHNVKTLVLITSPPIGSRLAAKIDRHAHYGYRVLCHFLYFASGRDEEDSLIDSVRRYLHEHSVDDVILALPSKANDLATQLILHCENQGINVRIVPDLFPLIQTDTEVHDLDGIPLINVRHYPAENFRYAVLKRLFDVALSLAALVLFSPLFLLIAIFIKLTSTGPVFFTQERVGLNGKPFRMLKFRTMRQDPALNSGNHWTARDDPYVTPIGWWLRRSNLDELPQFLNVLKGDMSVVGPRPERRFFLERFRQEVPDYMSRHYVKCGITGWAQVNGWRGDTSIAQRVAHDLYYIRNWAMGLDIKILLLTLTRTFFHRNAY